MLWIGTDWGGLYRENPDGRLKNYFARDKGNTISTDVVKSLASGPNGLMLIGTYKYGLSTYDAKRATPFKHFTKTKDKHTGLPNNHIWSVFTDHKGNRVVRYAFRRHWHF